MNNNRWVAYFNIEIVNSKCESQFFVRHFILNEYSVYLAYKLALDEAERIINTTVPGGWIAKIELI